MASLQERIAAELRAAITDGTYQPGGKLPTEIQLMDRYDVSRNTVRGATDELVNEGLVLRVPGRSGGVYVRDTVMLTYHASSAEFPEGLYSESDAYFGSVIEQGYTPSQRFSVAIESAERDVAARLQVTAGSAVTVRHCLRFVNGQPASTQVTYYPEWLTDQVTELLSPRDIQQGTTRLLADRGHQQTAFVDEITARMPSPTDATSLDIPAGTPILVYIRTGWAHKRAVRVTVCTFPADRNRLVYTLGDATDILRGEPQ